MKTQRPPTRVPSAEPSQPMPANKALRANEKRKGKRKGKGEYQTRVMRPETPAKGNRHE